MYIKAIAYTRVETFIDRFIAFMIKAYAWFLYLV
jgi:hypothetical protein